MITTETADGITTVTLNRPHRLNALTWQTMDQLHAAIDHAADAEDVRAIVLTGAGRAFCSGYDLVNLDTSQGDLGTVIAQEMTENLNPLCAAITHCPKPIVAAVNGPCAGGGLGIALLADVTIAARSAYFLVPQVSALGIAPDAGATWILARHVGRARALGMALLGDRIPAERAQQWGLIWQCVDDADLVSTARATAARISTTPTASVSTRALVDDATSAEFADQLAGETQAQRELFADPVVTAAIDRFART